MKDHDYIAQVKLKHNQLPAVVDAQTGEVVKIIEPRTDESVVVIQYDNYFMFNYELLNKLAETETINRTDKGYLLEMANMCKTEYNALFQKNNFPHTIDTLSSTLDMSYNKMSSMLKRFVKIGILGRLTVQDRTMYVMNPFLARKRKFVSVQTLNVFPDFGTSTHVEVSNNDQ